MANPNLLNATSMYAKTIAHSSGASATLLTCPSDKLIKIVSITLTNPTSSSISEVHYVRVNDQTIYSAASLAGYAEVTIIGLPIYLMETGTLKWAQAASDAGFDITVSYEEYDDA